MIDRLKRLTLPLSVIGVAVLIVSVLIAARPQPDVNEEPPRPLRVHVAPAQQGDTQLVVETNGEVRSHVRSEVVAQVAGRVVAVSPEFIEGGAFTAGDTLLQIEADDYRAALEQAEAQLAAATVDLEQALADADVARKQLAGTKNPSPLALKKPQVARAQAAVEAAEARLASAKLNLARTDISLPFDGRLESTAVDLGQFVNAGKVVARAFGTDRVEVRLPLTDEQLGALGVAIGFSAKDSEALPVDLTATVGGVPHRWSGRLTRLDAAVDPATRVVYATAEVEGPYDTGIQEGGMPLAVGLFVKAAISGQIVSDAIRIPIDGLRAGNQVFVLEPEGVLAVREVDVLYRWGDYAVLRTGISAGDRVIVSSIRNAIPGMRLEAIESTDSALKGALSGVE